VGGKNGRGGGEKIRKKLRSAGRNSGSAGSLEKKMDCQEARETGDNAKREGEEENFGGVVDGVLDA